MNRHDPPAGLVAALRGAPADDPGPVSAAEIESLRRTRDELERRVRELDAQIHRLEADARAAVEAPPRSPEEEDRALRRAVREGFKVDVAEVSARSERLASAVQARARRLVQAGDDAELQRRLGEAQELAHLDRLHAEAPNGRVARAVAQRANQLRRRLRPYLLEAESEIEALDAESHEIAVLAALEPAEGPPTALGLVLPVPADVHGEWRRHGDDLSARLAWRVLAVLAVALRDCGAADAPVRVDRFAGCLSLQVWLGDSDVQPGLKDALIAGFDQIHEQAGELRRANLELFLAWVDASILTDGGPE